MLANRWASKTNKIDAKPTVLIFMIYLMCWIYFMNFIHGILMCRHCLIDLIDLIPHNRKKEKQEKQIQQHPSPLQKGARAKPNGAIATLGVLYLLCAKKENINH